MQPLLDPAGARSLTTALDGTADPEVLRSPRLFLEYRALGPAGSALLRRMLATPIWAGLPVLLTALVAGMLIARRGATPEAPGRFAFGAAAFATGVACAGSLLMLALLHQALRGTLDRQLPVFAALAAAGAGLGAAAAARPAGRAGRAPRMTLAAVGFVWLLLLLLSVALGNLAAPGPAAGPLIGAAVAALGLAGGLELGLLMHLCPEVPGRAGPFALIMIPGLLGAAVGSGLVAAGLLPAFGLGAALLLLLGLKLVELGVVAAGAGRPAKSPPVG
jgi:hypothetical protein